MKKTLTAIAAGLLLVAGQAAAAQSNSATVRVADRVGASTGESSEFAGSVLPGLLFGAAIIVGFAVAVDDNSQSD